MTKPNVAILHYAAPPTIGGVESTIAAHARLFASNGYSVRVVTGRGEVFDSRVPVEIIPDAGSRSARVLEVNAELDRGVVSDKFQALVQDLSDALETVLAPSQGRLCLIAHNVLSLHKNLALTAAVRKLDRGAVQVIAWCHDFAWTDPQYAHQVHAGEPWDWLREPWPGVRYVVVSEARQRELQALWGDGHEVKVVPAGIDPLEFLGITPEAAGWTRELGLLEAAPLLLLPARLTRRKRVEAAIEITAALCRRGLNPKLVVTGPPGPHNPTNVAYLDKLRKLVHRLGVEKAVIFLHEYGEVFGAAMRDLYLLADALVFPSEREGFGIPVLEAGLARLPVFCSDLEPFRESARGDAHYFRPSDPPEAVADQIGEFLTSDPAYRLKQRVVKEYAWERLFSERIEPLVNPRRRAAEEPDAGA